MLWSRVVALWSRVATLWSRVRTLWSRVETFVSSCKDLSPLVETSVVSSRDLMISSRNRCLEL
ncbi:hypothetical protein Hanom_Chr15g01346931 [Helianthus anomalus]